MEIKASDLRIGNWVFNPKKEAIEVKEISSIGTVRVIIDNHYTDAWFGFHINEISGIPLTHEILLKAGFRSLDPIKGDFKRILTQYSYNDGEFVVEHVSGGFNIYSCRGYFCNLEKNVAYSASRITKHGHLQYLHQLQNLYHALTSTELKIEL